MNRLLVPFFLAGMLTLGGARAEETQNGPVPSRIPVEGLSLDKLRPLPIPEDLQAHIAQSRKLGRAIYEQDMVSAKATDVLVAAKLLPGKGEVRGWVTREWPDGWVVDFMTAPAKDTENIIYRVRFQPDRSKPELTVFEPMLPADAETAALFRARQSAIGALLDRCTQRVNPVILPAELVGKRGWLVYVLASTTEPNVLILGGHIRFIISPDGKNVLENYPLYEQCMSMEFDPAAFAAFINHRRTDWPLESHVFASLLYNKAIFIQTRRGLWKVEGEQVEYYGRPVP